VVETHVPPAIVVENVTVERGGVAALDKVSFAIEHGVMVGVVGPNGAGKSTLFNAILGLLPLTHGRIQIHGVPFSQIRGELAYVPQQEKVNWRFPLTAWDVVMLGRQRKIGWIRRASKEDKSAVGHCLERVGLLDSRSRLVSELSGGQRQRVFVARALAQEAHTLLLDEAFSGVDVGSQEGLVEILRSLAGDGKTILMATHDLTNLAERFDFVLCLNKHVCAWGPPSVAFTPLVLEELYGSHGVSVENGKGDN
jgi:ABC-type Mn2+/Zn2+ transport system ATPase subunit